MTEPQQTKPLAFYDHHRQDYGHMPIGSDAEFMVGDYSNESGVGDRGEFKIDLVALDGYNLGSRPMLHPRLHVFGDALGALTAALEAGLGDVLAQEYCNRDDFTAALLGIGFTDRSHHPVGHRPICPCCGRAT